MHTGNPIPKDQWTAHFDAFSKRLMREDVPEIATVTVRGGPVREGRAVQGARLLGVTYDRNDNILDVALEGVDHLVWKPIAIWTRETDDGFIDQITVLREDGSREVVTFERVGETATNR